MYSNLVKNYIGEKWTEPDNYGYLNVDNPSTDEIIGKTPLSTEAEVNRAVAAAAKAYPGWSSTPVSARVKPIFRLTELLRENEEKIARILTEEMGKSLPDARAEIKRSLKNCEVACGMAVHQQGDKLVGSATSFVGTGRRGRCCSPRCALS